MSLSGKNSLRTKKVTLSLQEKCIKFTEHNEQKSSRQNLIKLVPFRETMIYRNLTPNEKKNCHISKHIALPTQHNGVVMLGICAIFIHFVGAKNSMKSRQENLTLHGKGN